MIPQAPGIHVAAMSCAAPVTLLVPTASRELARSGRRKD
jgi:hypothetical protein